MFPQQFVSCADSSARQHKKRSVSLELSVASVVTPQRNPFSSLTDNKSESDCVWKQMFILL